MNRNIEFITYIVIPNDVELHQLFKFSWNCFECPVNVYFGCQRQCFQKLGADEQQGMVFSVLCGQHTLVERLL